MDDITPTLRSFASVSKLPDELSSTHSAALKKLMTLSFQTFQNVTLLAA